MLDPGIATFRPILSRSFQAYAYGSAPKVIGIEVNSHFCEIQQNVVTKYGMQDRVLVLCADVCTEQDVLSVGKSSQG
jgi:predicted RNA methylase